MSLSGRDNVNLYQGSRAVTVNPVTTGKSRDPKDTGKYVASPEGTPTDDIAQLSTSASQNVTTKGEKKPDLKSSEAPAKREGKYQEKPVEDPVGSVARAYE